MPYGKRSSRQRPHDAASSSRAPSIEREQPGPCRPLRAEPEDGGKWRGRTTTADAPMGPKAPKSTVLTPAEEAIVVAFRQKTLLPLDDVLGCLKDTIPNLSRSALHRCLQRHGISRLPVEETRLSASGSRPTRSATSTSTAANCATPTASSSCSWPSIGRRSSPTSSSTTAPARWKAVVEVHR